VGEVEAAGNRSDGNAGRFGDVCNIDAGQWFLSDAHAFTSRFGSCQTAVIAPGLVLEQAFERCRLDFAAFHGVPHQKNANDYIRAGRKLGKGAQASKRTLVGECVDLM
ncbi:MAG: hypothetical protein P4N59_11330, partial [Negativicutes bacterium]|nr:hypothetical protein [Negativicutes bacterium]